MAEEHTTPVAAGGKKATGAARRPPRGPRAEAAVDELGDEAIAGEVPGGAEATVPDDDLAAAEEPIMEVGLEPEPESPGPAVTPDTPEPAPESSAPASVPLDVALPVAGLWKNETRGPVGIRVYDVVKGSDVVLIRSGQQRHVTEVDRKLTDETVLDPKKNPFVNGQLTPMFVVEGDADLEQLADHPNLISRTAIEELLSGNVKVMETKIQGIDSLITLERILEVANTEGSAIRRIEIIQGRLTALKAADAERTEPGAEPMVSGPLPEPFYPPEMGGKAAEGGTSMNG